ncbi:HAD-IA family hydrolase [archaeon]|nr:HAD-IA family hydrolase [archaeon]MBT4416802.1 HAD-IA family hydrolase [archaeon]
MKKAVLFDLDNTLYDYDKPHKKALKNVYRVLKKHVKISFPRFLLLFGFAKREIHRELAGTAAAHNRILYFQRLIEKTESTVDPGLNLLLYNAYWDCLLKNMRLRPGALDVLKELKKKGLKVAIVSDLTTNIQLRKLKKLNIGKYIDVLVTSEEAGSEKPHQIMFLLALNKLRLRPHEAIMVGDNSITDIEGANSVGMDTVLLKRGILAKVSKEDYRKPNYVVKGIPGVLKILEKV